MSTPHIAGARHDAGMSHDSIVRRSTAGDVPLQYDPAWSGSQSYRLGPNPNSPQSRYGLRERIGAGNHGVVFRAWDSYLGREVAIKRFSHYLADDRRAMRRITREVEALAKVSHPNVVTIYDLVHLPDGDGEITPHLVMELIEGASLRDLLAAQGPNPRAVLAVKSVLAGLAACHRAGVLHLDIKPGNILVTAQGAVKIVDFGIARAATDSIATVAGTPHYMAPEQCDGRADQRSDIYSVAGLLYECLTGQSPFQGTMASQLMAHRTEQRPDPRAISPRVGPGLANVVLRAMAIEPDRRFGSAEQMLAALESVEIAPMSVPGSATAQSAGRATIRYLPVQNSPVQNSPVQNSPVQNSPVQNSPVQNRRVQAEPVRNNPTRMDSRAGESTRGRRSGSQPPANDPPGVPLASGQADRNGRAAHDAERVTRWSRLQRTAAGLGISAFVLALLPALIWSTTSIEPASRYIPSIMYDFTAWWLLAIAIAVGYLAIHRAEFGRRIAGPPPGSLRPVPLLDRSACRAIAQAGGAALRGSVPLLLPWYVVLVSVLAESLGLDWPADPYRSGWIITWCLLPLIAGFLTWQALRRIRLSPARILASTLLFAGACIAGFLFVVVANLW